MIRELLAQRINDYNEMTKKIIGLYEEKLIKALRFYTKTDRVIKINSIELFPLNHNFIIYSFATDLIEGDKIKLPDGSSVVIDKTNLKSFNTEPIKLVMPIDAMETYDANQLYELLKKVDAFIKAYGEETYQKGLKTGIVRFEELLENSDHSEIFDSVEDPMKSILESLDELQKLELELYSTDIKKNKVLH